jgi:hypothetical protein
MRRMVTNRIGTKMAIIGNAASFHGETTKDDRSFSSKNTPQGKNIIRPTRAIRKDSIKYQTTVNECLFVEDRIVKRIFEKPQLTVSKYLTYLYCFRIAILFIYVNIIVIGRRIAIMFT